jgi:hypothetical protein
MPVGKVPGAGSLPYLLQTVAQSFYLTAPPHHRRTPSHLFLTRNGCMYQQVFQSLQKANRIYLIFFIILRSIYFLEFLSNYSLVQYCILEKALVLRNVTSENVPCTGLYSTVLCATHVRAVSENQRRRIRHMFFLFHGMYETSATKIMRQGTEHSFSSHTRVFVGL